MPYIDWEGCECVILANKDSNQYLELHHSNGGYPNQFDIFTVSYVTPEIKNYRKTVSESFTTENGIQLGLSLNAFTKIFSKINFEKEKKSSKEITYRYHDVNNTYLAEYTFKNGSLYKFRIGYDNS